jgi:cytochrome o ubiquinol oxidase operon protein cyoD
MAKQGNTKSLKAYVAGFSMSLALTITAFLLMKIRFLPDSMLYVSLAALAILQLIVQSACFLGMNTKQEGRWNLLPFLFTLFVIAILVSGSLWIMYNMNYNMLMSINSDAVL